MMAMPTPEDEYIDKLQAEIKRLREFIETIVDATGPYQELNGKPIIRAAYKALKGDSQ